VPFHHGGGVAFDQRQVGEVIERGLAHRRARE
jgi:hypothetical protein